MANCLQLMGLALQAGELRLHKADVYSPNAHMPDQTLMPLTNFAFATQADIRNAMSVPVET